MKYLLISHDYPPLIGPESIQSARLASWLGKYGWDAYVLCTKPALCHAVDNNLESFGEVTRAKTYESNILKGIVYLLARSFLYYPDTKISWIPSALEKGREILRKNQIDLIFSRSNPFTSHLVAKKLKQEFGKKWVAHFSDPWVDNTYLPKNISNFVLNQNKKWESEIIAEADVLLFTSSETVDLVMSKYSKDLMKKVHIIPHTFEPNLLNKTMNNSINNKIVISHIGNFYGARTPEDLFIGLSKAIKANPDIENKLVVKLFGRIQNNYLKMINELGISKIVEYNGVIPYMGSLDEMLCADVLLTIDAAGNNSVFLPCKLVEYLAANRPIISLTPKVGTSARLLSELGHIVIENQDHEAISNQVLKLYNDGTGWIKFDNSCIDKYHPKKVAEKVSEIFSNAVKTVGDK